MELGGSNIVFGQFDINAGASTDPKAGPNLAFSLVDNVRITEYTNVVTVTNTVSAAYEVSMTTPGVFTINRTSGWRTRHGGLHGRRHGG